VILGGYTDYHAIVTFDWNSMEYKTRPEGEFLTIILYIFIIMLKVPKKVAQLNFGQKYFDKIDMVGRAFKKLSLQL
jgi:hypothetical protein